MISPDLLQPSPPCKIARPERMNGINTQRRRRGALKTLSVSDTEYFSDSHTVDGVEEPNSTSHSDQCASEVESPGEESDRPIASSSTLPSQPSTSIFPGELKVSAEPDLAESIHERAWYKFDLSVVLALLSPLANWLTGGDYVKNLILILLLVFYLHQIIEAPWSLYLSSRPRRSLRTPPQDYTSAADEYHRSAVSQLRKLEIFYLTLSILSPFIGATLLRTVVISFSGPSTVSWFSLSLFVLATGMRPWKHAIQRLRECTTDLHTIIHYPPSHVLSVEALVDRVTQLEVELKTLRKQSKTYNSNMYEQVEDAIGMMEISTRRQEKKAEVSKAYVEGRLVKLEQNVEVLLERMEIRADRPVLQRITAQLSALISALIELLIPILPIWIVVRCRGNVSRSPRSSPKMARSRTSIKLETIPEVATFQPKCSGQSSRFFCIPGLSLALRITDFATFPLRRIVDYFLVGQLHTPRTRP